MIELGKLQQLLMENATLKVQINGHTDNVGAPTVNLKLSNDRAKTVVDFLIKQGINSKRLTYKGFGETKPIGENKTEEGRALNRRTEFLIVGE
jgi:outer membrane protein OmpA-like peptidoglycan-associated protein